MKVRSRPSIPWTVALVVAGLLCGCGSSTPAATTGSTPAGAKVGVTFSECMRTNGVADFPDPGPSGQLTIDQVANGSSLDTTTPAFTRALAACKALEPSGFTGTTRSAQQQEAALRFAQCVRDHGVKDFPDPTPDGPLIDTNRIPSAATGRGMSILNAAMRSCRDYSSAAGVTGGR
jgi:hypothetical protein